MKLLSESPLLRFAFNFSLCCYITGTTAASTMFKAALVALLAPDISDVTPDGIVVERVLQGSAVVTFYVVRGVKPPPPPESGSAAAGQADGDGGGAEVGAAAAAAAAAMMKMLVAKLVTDPVALNAALAAAGFPVSVGRCRF